MNTDLDTNAVVLDILLVDDEAIIHESIGRYLRKCGHRVTFAHNGVEALCTLEQNDFHLALIDLRMPRKGGLALLRDVRVAHPDLVCVMMTAYADLDAAVQAIRFGAQDFLRKPIMLAEVDAVLARVRNAIRLQGDNRRLKGAIRSIQRFDGTGTGASAFLGCSPAAASVRDQIELAVQNGCDTILVSGETGVGKEVVAREIHRLGSDDEHPFIAVNCPAVPVSLLESELFGHVKGTFTGATSDRLGSFELADGGTLLLDEIADLPMQAQAAILRVVETRRLRRVGGSTEKTVRLRLIAATNARLDERVREGRFRSDLLYRLNVFTLHVSPLRERREDIEELANHFLTGFAGRRGLAVKGFAASALDALAHCEFPGNVRELRNRVERAVVVCRGEWVEDRHLALVLPPAPGRSAGDSGAGRMPEAAGKAPVALNGDERDQILDALEQTRWNRRKASVLLGMSYSTLREKIAKFAIR